MVESWATMVVWPLHRSLVLMVLASWRNATFLLLPASSSTRGVSGLSAPERAGRSLMRTERRWLETCSVRTVPRISLEPYLGRGEV